MISVSKYCKSKYYFFKFLPGVGCLKYKLPVLIYGRMEDKEKKVIINNAIYSTKTTILYTPHALSVDGLISQNYKKLETNAQGETENLFFYKIVECKQIKNLDGIFVYTKATLNNGDRGVIKIE